MDQSEVLCKNEVIKMLVKNGFQFPTHYRYGRYPSKQNIAAKDGHAYGVINWKYKLTVEHKFLQRYNKENLDLMNMYCLYCCGIFPWPTS